MKAEETFEVPEVALGSYANFSSRFVARVIDAALLGLVSAAIWGVYYVLALLDALPDRLLMAGGYLAFPVYVAYFATMTARSGQTFGKRFIGVQVQAADGNPPSIGASVWRTVVDLFFYMTAARYVFGFIDYLWLYLRKDRRTLHDLAAGTTVRVVRPSPNWPVTAFLLATLLTILAQVPAKLVTYDCHENLENMSPAIARGDWWSASRLAYRAHAPGTGDVVAFWAPRVVRSGYAVGRIVGVGGDYVTLRNGVVGRVSGQPKAQAAPDGVFVPADSVAVLGDNRATPEAGGYPRPPTPPASHGTDWPVRAPQTTAPTASASPIVVVPVAAIKGKVAGVTWPLWRMHVVR
jgi:uncharacterized RDD family membrane protein YckC